LNNGKIFKLCGVLFMIMVLTSCAVNNNTVEESAISKSESSYNIPESSVIDNEWETEYNKKLHDYYAEMNEGNHSPQEINYDIYDLDGDDIPELIISAGFFHAGGCRIYSYVNSEVIELGWLGQWGVVSFYPKSGLMYSPWSGQGHYVAKWYEIKDHEMKLLYTYGFWLKEGGMKLYEINGESASEEEYNEYLEEHSDKTPSEDEEKIELGKGKVYKE